jgi:putative membrane protein
MPSTLSYLLPWEFSPTVLLACLLCAGAYVRGLAALNRRGEPVGFWRPFAFFLGLALNYAALQTYFDYLSQHMFWVHRLQHLILHHLAPVALALSAPGEAMLLGVPLPARERLLRAASRHQRVIQRCLRFVQHPLVALLLFVGLIYVWLIPSVHFGAMLDADRYRIMNWSMAVDGILFWWLMLTPREKQGAAAVGYGIRVLVLCIAAVLQILLGAHIALHKSVLFDVYGICGRAWALDPLVDQELGGLLTWIPAAMMSGFGVLVVLHRILHSPQENAPVNRLASSTRES